MDNITIEITLPRAWLRHVELVADDALRGRDSYWLKQLMGKIQIAAMQGGRTPDQLSILIHALRLIASEDNEEGWATDQQIAEHYLKKAGVPSGK